MKVLIIIQKVNVVRPIAESLVGKHHSFRHRACTGIAIMVTGVFIAKFFGHSDYIAAAIAGDVIGYALHGVGLVPFVEALLAKWAEEA
jgi:hypothetical protein